MGRATNRLAYYIARDPRCSAGSASRAQYLANFGQDMYLRPSACTITMTDAIVCS